MMRMMRAAILAILSLSLAVAADTPSRHRPWHPGIGDVTWGGGQFVAVGGQGLVMTSPDGWHWTVRRHTGTEWGKASRKASPDDLNGIAWGNGTYLAIGADGRLLASRDGTTWQERPIQQLQGAGQQVYWTNGLFIVIGDGGRLFTSVDGIDWNRESTGTDDDLADLAGLANGRIVVIGRRGTALVSSDGHVWTVTKDQVPPELDRIASSGTRLVAVGNLAYGTVVAQSTDGQHWSSREFRGFEHLYNDVTWHDGLFVTVGGDIAVSTRAVTWMFLNARPSDVARPDWRRVTGNGKVFVAIGQPGEVVGSYDGVNWYGGRLYRAGQDPDVYVVNGTPVDASPLVESDTVIREWLHQSVAYERWQVGLYAALFVLYFVLQAYVPMRTTGYWHIAAILPGLVLLGPIMLKQALDSLTASQLLWPLWPFYPAAIKLPVACVYLVLLQVLYDRQRLRPAGKPAWPWLTPALEGANARLLGWLCLGLVAGLFTGPVAMPPMALLLFAGGSTLLLAGRLRRPSMWFGAGILGGAVGMLAGGLIGVPLMFMGIPNVAFTIQFLAMSLAQFVTLGSEERPILRHWVLVNVVAAASATALATLIEFTPYKGSELYYLVTHHWGYSERVATAAVEASWGVPFCLIVCVALGLYLRSAFRRIGHADRVARD